MKKRHLRPFGLSRHHARLANRRRFRVFGARPVSSSTARGRWLTGGVAGFRLLSGVRSDSSSAVKVLVRRVDRCLRCRRARTLSRHRGCSGNVDLPVGLGPVSTRFLRRDSDLVAGVSRGVGPVGGPVVGQHAFDDYAAFVDMLKRYAVEPESDVRAYLETCGIGLDGDNLNERLDAYAAVHFVHPRGPSS